MSTDAADSSSESRPATGHVGSVEAGPANVRNFSPDEVTKGVDVEDLSLREVFEDLGPSATEWFQHVQTLANPMFEGRAPGTRGGELAAEYIEYFFGKAGLRPAFPSTDGNDQQAAGSYRQPFDFASPSPKVQVLKARVELEGIDFAADDFAALGNSASASVAAPVTFVGYGIQEGNDNYSSFDDNTNLEGRIALLLRYEPLDENGKSRWSPNRFSRFSSLAAKIKNLTDRNAAGIILVNPPGAVDGESGLEIPNESVRFSRRLDIPIFQLTPEAADRLLAAVDPERRDLASWRSLADRGEVRCVDLGSRIVTLDAQLEVDDRIHTCNLAGVIPGRGDLAKQWIVIGAHYDHVGYGYTGATTENVGKLHPGADDNASGTAGLLMAASRLTSAYAAAPETSSLRSIMVVAFGAEEAGLHGSKYLVEHSPVQASDITLMINMDMIGRLRSDNLLVQGSGTAEGFDEMLRPHFEASGLKISLTPGGRGPSDHSSFYNAGIPILFLFTGEHAEYHKPEDRAYTVNPRGAAAILDLLQSIVMDMADNAEPLKYVMTSAGGSGRNTGARVRLGIQPVYDSQVELGVEVEGVTDGTSAAEAGIQAGDVLVEWNGESLDNARKLFELLGKHEPGDRVKLMVQRGGQTIPLDVTLRPSEPR